MNSSFSIYLVGSFREFAFETIYQRYFKQLGAIVNCFDIQEPVQNKINKNLFNKVISKLDYDRFCLETNKLLIQNIKFKRPDVVMVFKGMQILPATLLEIKKSTKILANYNPDHPFNYYSAGAGNNNILNSVDCYDIHFSYSKNIVEKFEKEYNKKSYWIPFGYDEALKPIHTGLQVQESFLFVGAWDSERAKYLNQLQEFNIKIFGNSPWMNRTVLKPNVKRMYQSRPLLKGELLYATKLALGNINLLRKQNKIEESHNMRTFEVPGYGGLLISERSSEQQEFFEENKEMVFFSSLEEHKDKLRFFSKNSSLASEIKYKGYQRCISSKYGYSFRVKSVFDIFKHHLK